jgi:uncharacterized protein YecT (DUF1311 family)
MRTIRLEGVTTGAVTGRAVTWGAATWGAATWIAAALVGLPVWGCAPRAADAAAEAPQQPEAPSSSRKDEGQFPIGAAVDAGARTTHAPLLVQDSNSVTAENEMKVESGEPTEGKIDDSNADASQTQLSMNQNAALSTKKVEDRMRKAYGDLRRGLVQNQDALEKLELAQQAWQAYSTAHEVERFPGDKPRSQYGSVFPTCLLTEREVTTSSRINELSRGNPCKASRNGSPSQPSAQSADAALNEAYGQVRSTYAADTTFLEAMKTAQRAWLKFRDAQVAFAVAANGKADSTCAERETETVTRARTNELRQWLNPHEEGDACMGSFMQSR